MLLVVLDTVEASASASNEEGVLSMKGLSRLIDASKPTDEEIRRLALRETDPLQADAFAPIARGSVFALTALVLVLLAALPFCLIRTVRFLLRRATP